MNNLLHKLKALAALLFLVILSGSLYSQTVISSVIVSKNANELNTQLTRNTSNSIILDKDSENWMSNKSYLDIGSLSENI